MTTRYNLWEWRIWWSEAPGPVTTEPPEQAEEEPDDDDSGEVREPTDPDVQEPDFEEPDVDEINDEHESEEEDDDEETLNGTIDNAESQLPEPSPKDAQESAETIPEPPSEFEGGTEEWETVIESCDNPGRAKLTTKRINGNEYLYRQWSKNGTTKSECIAPKKPT